MTNKEMIKRDIATALDFAAQIIEHPDLLDKIPEAASITFLDDEDVKKESFQDRIPHKKYVRVKRRFEVL
jgi:hypothetical protein